MRPQGFADPQGCEHRILRDVVKQRQRACDLIRYGEKLTPFRCNGQAETLKCYDPD